MSSQTESVFAVTTEPRMEIGSGRRGRATVSVSNRSGRTFDAVRARVVPEGGADPSWFHLEDPVRRMAPGALEQFVVEARLPADAPPGEHRFRLHVADEEIPDDHFATSPTVAFTAPAAEKEEKSRWPLWAAIAAAVVLAVALGTYFACQPGAKPGLGESCEGECAGGLTCEDGFCVGTIGFRGCTDPSDCADDLLCSGGVCAGGLGFESCGDGAPCGDELTCEAGTCRGELGFAGCSRATDCAGELTCLDGTCAEPRQPPPPTQPTLGFEEDCLRHDPQALTITRVRDHRGGATSQSWRIVQGRRSLFSFPNREEAETALAVIRRFGFDHACYIGRPDASMTYFKKGDTVPSGSSRGLDCLGFDRASVGIRSEGARWLLASDRSRMMMLPNETEARQALEVIQTYGLDRHCFIGRPDPSLEYWLAE